MTLDDIYDALATGELSQVILGNDGTGVLEIPEDRRRQIRRSLQLGLTDLHTRFLIREKRVRVTMIPGKNVYLLDSKYAVSNTKSTATKYLVDTEDPFDNSLLQVERIYDALGNKISLNELSNELAIRTLSDNTLLVPEGFDTATVLSSAGLDTTSLMVYYRADHTPLDKYVADAAPTIVPIALPSKYMQALLYFIAHRALNPIGFNDRTHEGNNFAQKYEMECQRLVGIGAGIETVTSNDLVMDAGWV
jgi:hypothetical protein